MEDGHRRFMPTQIVVIGCAVRMARVIIKAFDAQTNKQELEHFLFILNFLISASGFHRQVSFHFVTYPSPSIQATGIEHSSHVRHC